MINCKLFILCILLSIIILGSSYAITDSNPSNNVLNVTINVVETSSFELHYYPIDNPSNFEGNITEMTDFINRTYPIADDKIKIIKGEPKQSFFYERNDIGTLFLAFRVAKLSTLAGDIRRGVGILRKNWFFDNNIDGLGVGYIWGLPGVLVEESEYRQAAAHEIGHTFQLCEEYNYSNEWDSQNLTLSRLGYGGCFNSLDLACLDEGTGCDTSIIGKINPWNKSNETIKLHNFMGVNKPELTWISNETYRRLLNRFNKSNIILSSSTLAVTGLINKSSGITKFDPIYILGERTLSRNIPEGNYTIEFLDSNNNLIQNLSFNPSFTISFFNGTTKDTNLSFFIFVMNYTSNLSKIRIKEGNLIKDERNKTINAPSLNLTFPIGGELVSNMMNITYNASDIDGDNISYAILISSDNGDTFSTLEIDYINKSLFVNTSSLNDGKQYKVKILATDGINTNTTISQNTFEIDNDMRLTNLSTIYENKTRKIFFYKNKNTLEDNLSNVKEQLNTGDFVIEFTNNHPLASNEEVFIFVEYNYTIRGDKTVTATAISGSLTETESAIINIPDVEVLNLVILDSTITKRIFRFDIKNNLDVNLTNLNWTFDTNNNFVINSTITSILQPSEQMFVYIDYNFTSAGIFNVNATARNGSLTDSRNLTISIN